MEWEYEVRQLDTSGDIASIRDDVQRSAREGWELVSVAPHDESPSQSTAGLLAFFKRETHETGEGGTVIESA